MELIADERISYGFRDAGAVAVGPILDPTLYRQAGDNLHAVKRLAEGLQHFRRVANELAGEKHDG